MNEHLFKPGMRVDRDPDSMKHDPVRSIVRAAIAHGRYALNRNVRPDEYAEKTWPFDQDVLLVLRAATTPTSMTDALALVPIVLALLPMLAPVSAGAALFEAALKLQFSADAATFSIPGVIPPNAVFVGEGLPKPVGQGLSNAATMSPHKIASIVVASAELLAQPTADAMIRQMLAESAGPALDTALFGNAAGSGNVPPGLLNGLTPLTPAGGSATVYESLLADLGALGGAVAGVAGNGKICFILAPPQAVTAKLAVQPGSYDIYASTALAPGTAIAVAVNALASAMGVPAFETSTQATLQMDDAASGSLLSKGPVSSMFQTSSVALKMVTPATWARRAAGGVAFMTGVNW